MSKVYETEVVEFKGELAIVFPDELIKKLGWKIGDIVNITSIPGKDAALINKVEKYSKKSSA